MILVASENKAKIKSVEKAIALMGLSNDVKGLKVASGVRDQPMSDQETKQGAHNRAQQLKQLHDADYYIGIEGGVQEIDGVWMETGWICVLDKTDRVGYGTSGRYQLSNKIMNMIHSGMELADVIDHITGQTDVRSNQGAMGIITNGLLPRDEAYIHGILFAFGPFVSPSLLWDE
ncbi:Non-canonical purine NTP phosphatase/PRRC1 [Gorgonomyces haynaldii]|nr:Non-canonical purine NTP phosphatase/PRRC1 [Gorgonomyces haynaldii]